VEMENKIMENEMEWKINGKWKKKKENKKGKWKIMKMNVEMKMEKVKYGK
jgi:hypothetical protein